ALRRDQVVERERRRQRSLGRKRVERGGQNIGRLRVGLSVIVGVFCALVFVFILARRLGGRRIEEAALHEHGQLRARTDAHFDVPKLAAAQLFLRRSPRQQVIDGSLL